MKHIVGYFLSIVMGAFVSHAALGQTFGEIKHRDELLEPSQNAPLNDRRKDQQLFEAAKDYWHGENGREIDRTKALQLFKLAARKDYPPALYYLSRILFVGEDMRTNEAAGIALLKRATQLGLQDAPIRLLEHDGINSHYIERIRVSIPGEVLVPVPMPRVSNNDCGTCGSHIAMYGHPLLEHHVPDVRYSSPPLQEARLALKERATSLAVEPGTYTDPAIKIQVPLPRQVVMPARGYSAGSIVEF